MIDTIGSVCDNLFRIARQNVRASGLSRENLQTLIAGNLELHQHVVYALSTFNDKEFNHICKVEAFPVLKKLNPKVVDAYTDYVRALDVKNRQLENKRMLQSLIDANSSFIKALGMISNHIDEILDKQKITIADTRLSTVAVLGIIQQSTWVAKFSLYLYTYITKGCTHTSRTIPRYREAYLCEHSQDVAKAVNKINQRDGWYTFLEEIRHLRENAQDSVLGADRTFGVTANQLTPSILDYLASALRCINIFRFAVEAWDDYCLWRNDCNKETKEWLEKHNALLRMKLDGIDPSSPEYTELENVIKAYDQNIADLDQKISEFEKDN